MIHVACVAIKLVTYVSNFSRGAVVFIAQRAKLVVVTNSILVSFVTFQILVET
jgi:hypothetical protein